MANKKRSKPRKRADTEAQVTAMLARYEKLVDKWTGEIEKGARRLAAARKKVQYYQKRLAAFHEDRDAPALAERRKLAKARRDLERDRARLEKQYGKERRGIDL